MVISVGFHVDSCHFSSTANRIRYSYRSYRSLSHISLSSLYLPSMPFSLHLFSCSSQLYLWLVTQIRVHVYVHYFSLLSLPSTFSFLPFLLPFYQDPGSRVMLLLNLKKSHEYVYIGCSRSDEPILICGSLDSS